MFKLPGNWGQICGIDLVVLNGRDVAIVIFRGYIGEFGINIPIGAIIAYSLEHVMGLLYRLGCEESAVVEIDKSLRKLREDNLPAEVFDERCPEVMSHGRWEYYEEWRCEEVQRVARHS